jgi:hypothetical protein
MIPMRPDTDVAATSSGTAFVTFTPTFQWLDCDADNVVSPAADTVALSYYNNSPDLEVPWTWTEANGKTGCASIIAYKMTVNANASQIKESVGELTTHKFTIAKTETFQTTEVTITGYK